MTKPHATILAAANNESLRSKTQLPTLIKISIVQTLGIIILLSLGRPTSAVPHPQGSFEKYIESNSRFGTKFFKNLRAEDPDKNIIYSPIGVSSLFACLREAGDLDIREELDRAFEWTSEQELGPSNRLLMARFIVPVAPLPEKERKKEAKKRYREFKAGLGKSAPDFALFFQREEDWAAWIKEEFWLKNSLLFQGRDFSSKFPKWFLGPAKDNFGLELREISDSREWKAYLSKFPEAQPYLDSGQSGRLFILNSVVRLGTKWKGDTFKVNDPRPGEFHPNPSSTVSVRMLLSKTGVFQYTKADNFEAVMLPAENADFTVIMPHNGVNLKTVEAALAENSGFLLPFFDKRFGDVELPEFSFENEHFLRRHLENLGVEEVFRDLGGLVKVPKSRLLGVKQAASIKIDQLGIQAEARTDVLGVEGGMEEEDQPFHMKVDRPFIFLVHDNITGVLLYLGAVIDPSRH